MSHFIKGRKHGNNLYGIGRGPVGRKSHVWASYLSGYDWMALFPLDLVALIVFCHYMGVNFTICYTLSLFFLDFDVIITILGSIGYFYIHCCHTACFYVLICCLNFSTFANTKNPEQLHCSLGVTSNVGVFFKLPVFCLAKKYFQISKLSENDVM